MNLPSCIAVIVAIWIAGYAVTGMLDQVGLSGVRGKYVSFTKSITVRPLANQWRKHRSKILWIGVGVIIALVFLQHVQA